MNNDDEIDLGQLFQTVWRGKWWIVLCGFFAVFLGGYYAFEVATPMYTSSSVVAFESREEQVVDLEGVVGGLNGDQATINTEVEVLRSRGLMRKLVIELDLIKDPEFNGSLRPKTTISVGKVISLIREQFNGPQPEPKPLSEEAILNSAISAALGKVSVSNLRQSYVFRITATTEQAEKSALIANTLAELYILDQLEVKFEATQKATDWLADRVGTLQIDLENAVEAVKDFNAKSELISPDALNLLNNRIKELRERIERTDAEIVVQTERLNALKNIRKTTNYEDMAQMAGDRTLTRLLGLLQSGEVPEATFLTRLDQLIEGTDSNLARTRTQQAALTNSLSELESQVARQSEDLIKLQQLDREAEANRLIYEYFLARLKETSVQQGIQQADARILSRAVVPLGPSAPRKSSILASSMMLGLLLGAGLVLLREMRQNTFRTPENLETLAGKTVLGEIPLIPARKRRNVLKYFIEKPTSAAAEAVRNLRTSTLLSDIDNPPRIIMTTSSIPAEGKTTLSITLAQNLSGLNKKVLLIEGDIRRRVFSEIFDLKEKSGLLSVLSGKENLQDAVIFSKELGSDLLISEKSKTNPADVFSSDAFKSLLRNARSDYDYIVIDTPPVLVVPDARIIGQYVDAILYNVKWDKTTKREVAAGLKSFRDVNVDVTGLVLSQINSKGMKRYGYEGKYGAYGKYGHGYYDN